MNGEARTPAAAVRRPLLREGARAVVVATGGLLVAVAGLLPAAVTPVAGQTLMTQDEALAAAFPAPATVERRTAYLTDAQLARARELAGPDVEIDQSVVTYYLARRPGGPAAVAYFDAHRVRTKAEVVMVVVSGARIDRVDILKFMEPPEYRAPGGWLDLFDGRELDDGLSARGSIPNLTGATLTARALTRAVRRVLALHAVIDPAAEP